MDPATKSPNQEAPTGLVVERRTHALSQLFKLSLVAMGVSCVSIIVGILVLVYSQRAGFPIVTGAPVWSGAAVLLTGILGVLASKSDVNYGSVPPPKARCLLMAHYIVSVSCLSVCGICFGYSLAGLSVCREGDLQCGVNHYQEEILNIIALCVAVLMFVTAIVGSVFFCVYRRLFGLYNLRELLYQAKIADLEGRVRSLETSNNPEQQRFGGQYGGQYSYNSFSTPTAPPPAYSK